MTAEQSGADASPGTTKPAGARGADDVPSAGAGRDSAAKPDIEEVKRKFREALERKHGVRTAGGGEAAQDTGRVHGSHGPAASRRSFRRKSG
jgi:Family of unknown function (DUF5302)